MGVCRRAGVDDGQRRNDASLVLAYCSRGSDMVYSFPQYVLIQDRKFRSLQLVAGVHLWGTAVENTFQYISGLRFDFCHFLDCDVCPKENTTELLVLDDKDVIVSPVWHYDASTDWAHLNVTYTRDRKASHLVKEPGTGIERVAGGSFASVVIKKRVFDAFVMADETFTTWTPMIDESFKASPPDAIFFEKVNVMGYECWVDWNCGVGTHAKYVLFNQPFVINLVKNYGSRYGKRERSELAGDPGAGGSGPVSLEGN